MDEELTIRRLEVADQHQIEGWASPSALKTLLKLPETSFGTNSNAWVALRNQVPVGVCSINENSNGTAYLDFIVKPSERRTGVGTVMIEAVLRDPVAGNIMRLRAVVEQDNTGAQKLLVKNGFSKIGFSEDGRLEFERH